MSKNNYGMTSHFQIPCTIPYLIATKQKIPKTVHLSSIAKSNHDSKSHTIPKFVSRCHAK